MSTEPILLVSISTSPPFDTHKTRAWHFDIYDNESMIITEENTLPLQMSGTKYIAKADDDIMRAAHHNNGEFHPDLATAVQNWLESTDRSKLKKIKLGTRNS